MIINRWLMITGVLFLISIFLTSCSTLQKNDVVAGDIMSIPELEENNYEVVGFGKEYASGKYVSLIVRKNEEKEEVYFDMINEKLVDKNSIQNFLMDEAYKAVVDAKGRLFVTNLEKQVVYEMDLIQQGYFETVKDLMFEFSTTNKYLLIRQRKTEAFVLINLENKKTIDIPFKGFISLDWSNSDKYVLVANEDSNRKLTYKHYVWDIEKNIYHELEDNNPLYLEWAPDTNNLWAIFLAEESGKYVYKIMKYSVKDKKWSVKHKINDNMDTGSFKVIQNEQFCYLEIRPYKKNIGIGGEEIYAVKLDASKNIVKEKQLKYASMYVTTWSYDYKYLYYINSEGLFRARVDF